MKEQSKWIRHGNYTGVQKVNLICFSYLGGSASGFAPWKKILGADIGISPVLFPMREVRRKEIMPDGLCKLVETFVAENEELFNKPFALFGHCAGAVAALETAKIVKEKYQKSPVCFIAGSCEAPAYAVEGIKEIAMIDEQDKMINRLLEQHLIEEDMAKDDTFIQYYFPLYRADARLYLDYDYEDSFRLDCPIMAIYGNQDITISSERLIQWQNVSNTGAFEEVCYDGAHYFTKEIVADILKSMSEFILRHDYM